MVKEYVDILTGEVCRHFRLLIWTLLIGQFVHKLLGKEIGLRGCMRGGVVILTSWYYDFIRVYKNLMQYPSNYISDQILCQMIKLVLVAYCAAYP